MDTADTIQKSCQNYSWQFYYTTLSCNTHMQRVETVTPAELITELTFGCIFQSHNNVLFRRSFHDKVTHSPRLYITVIVYFKSSADQDYLTKHQSQLILFSRTVFTVVATVGRVYRHTDCLIVTAKLFLLIMPPPRGHNAVIGVRRPSIRLSVCSSDVAYIGSNSKTKRPRKTKLCTGVTKVTRDSHTDFKVKRSKVKVSRGGAYCGGHLAAQLVTFLLCASQFIAFVSVSVSYRINCSNIRTTVLRIF